MLDILQKIVQKVNAAGDLRSALAIVVNRVQATLKSGGCAVYLLDETYNTFVLRAAKGFRQEAVDQVHLSYSEGLVGWVGTRAEPLNIADASSHAAFAHLPEIGEDAFKSFLGVPIIHHRKLLGILVIQSKAKKRFDEEVEAFLTTLASQLAVVLAHAEATGSIVEVREEGREQYVKFDGVSGALGAAIGQVAVVYPPADLDAVPDRKTTDIKKEKSLFKQALRRVKRDVAKVGKKLSKLGAEEKALFDVYVKILDDDAIGGEVLELIDQGQWAQGALKQVFKKHIEAFEAMDDSYLRERASDIRDLGRRVLAQLQERQQEVREYPENTILVGDELTPAILGEVPVEKLKGLVSVHGSGNSHIAIFARAMEIPAVLGAVDLPYKKVDGLEIVVDGYQGKVFSRPTAELKQHYQNIIDEEQAVVKGLEYLSGLPAETLDGHRVPLRVNTGLISDVARAQQRGAEGVGLYRTEVPFMMTDRFPSEKQQYDFYLQHLQAFAPYPVTMRTLDVGGDKALPYFPIKDDNPFLGWRGIRITLDHPEIFLVQLRAMLKASAGLDNLRIMLPMISSVSEVDEALHHIHQAFYEVREEGFDVAMPSIGVMVEVPAAVYQAREIAQRVDFLSVGSNDLTQYLLAVDRNNTYVSDIYNVFHPAVLKALEQIVITAHQEKTSVGLCGELAGDPRGAILLMAMGYDELSMNAASLLHVKASIRSVTMAQARQILEEVRYIDNADLVQSSLNFALKKLGLTAILSRVAG